MYEYVYAHICICTYTNDTYTSYTCITDLCFPFLQHLYVYNYMCSLYQFVSADTCLFLYMHFSVCMRLYAYFGGILISNPITPQSPHSVNEPSKAVKSDTKCPC